MLINIFYNATIHHSRIRTSCEWTLNKNAQNFVSYCILVEYSIVRQQGIWLVTVKGLYDLDLLLARGGYVTRFVNRFFTLREKISQLLMRPGDVMDHVISVLGFVAAQAALRWIFLVQVLLLNF